MKQVKAMTFKLWHDLRLGGCAKFNPDVRECQCQEMYAIYAANLVAEAQRDECVTKLATNGRLHEASFVKRADLVQLTFDGE